MEDVQLLLSYLVVQTMFHMSLFASFLPVANSQRVWENPTPYLLEPAARQHQTPHFGLPLSQLIRFHARRNDPDWMPQMPTAHPTSEEIKPPEAFS